MSVIVLELQEQLFDLFLVSLLERVLEIVCERAVTGKEPSAVHAAELFGVRLSGPALALLLHVAQRVHFVKPVDHAFVGIAVEELWVFVVGVSVVLIVIHLRRLPPFSTLIFLIVLIHRLICVLMFLSQFTHYKEGLLNLLNN